MKEIVNILNQNGYEAYIVGGYVRDFLLGINSKDIDICTDAPIDKIIEIFKGRGKAFREYFSYHIEENGYTYDITTYRKEGKYRRNKPVEIEIAPNLGTDLLRRDFTINTFAIDKDDNLIDLLGAKKDLDSRLIRMVGDTYKKLTEDKTRIIRALRFSCTLDFDLDPKIVDFFSNKKAYLLNEVPKEYKRKELDKIFECNNISRFFYFINKYNMDKYFNIKYSKIVKAYNKYGIWSQIETDLPFTNKEKRIIDSIRKLVSKKDITINDILEYDDEIIYNAAYILGIENNIKELKEAINLHSIIDIDMEVEELLSYVSVENIKKAYKMVEKNIIEGNINNNRNDIINFLRKTRL